MSMLHLKVHAPTLSIRLWEVDVDIVDHYRNVEEACQYTQKLRLQREHGFLDKLSRDKPAEAQKIKQQKAGGMW